MTDGKKHNNISSKAVDVVAVAIKNGELAHENDDAHESIDNESIDPENIDTGKNNGAGKNAQSIKIDASPDADPTIRKTAISKSDNKISAEDLERVNTNKGLRTLLQSKDIKLKKVLTDLEYEDELEKLQIELVKLQRWVQEKGMRVAILMEGRDAAGKGGTIRRFTEHLNPRSMRVVALPKPTQQEQGQWYFQRYSLELPNPGEIVFFDRSWYNRAVVEPVNGFCTKAEYQRFIQQVPEFEHMLYEDGIIIIKFWFSISKAEQKARFESRRTNPLKQWKLSPIDDQAQELWPEYTKHKEEMFSRTHMSFSPWIVVKANDKRLARLESIRYVLNLLDYKGKSDESVRIYPDPNIVNRFHRLNGNID